jgi:hypothetical protein
MSLPRAEGSLARHDVPDLLHRLHLDRWTGVVTVTHGGVARSITVNEGHLAFANSSNPDDRLGILLVRRGRISLRQLAAGVASIRPPMRLGTVLVKQGVLQPAELVQAVNEHSSEIIYGAFQWTEGSYKTKEGRADEKITLQLSTPDIILEGIRRIEAWSRVERAVGGLDALYSRAEDYERIIGLMELSFERLSLLTSLHTERDVQSICDESTLSDFEVFRTLWAFRVLGIVIRANSPASNELDDEGLDLVFGSA